VFVNNAVGSQEDADGNTYTVGTFYSMVNSGMRQIVPEVGDSFTFSVALTFFVIQNGISSKDIKILYNDAEIDYITLGIRRDAVTDQNVASNTTDGATTANVDSSALVIQLTAPLTTGAFSALVMQATLSGTQTATPLSITVQYPDDNSQAFDMYITSATVNAQGTKNASIEATLTQAMDLTQ
jgi:hypothetical protein